jgi:Fe-S cluster assembly scaffold protein SufB
LSNTSAIEELSKRLVEPSWLLDWRKARIGIAETLSSDAKYGINISGVSLGEASDLSAYPDYHVTPSKSLELYTWKEAMAQEEIAPILERLMTSELFPKPATHGSALGQAFFQTGLVVYVQPTLDDKGNAKTETLTLETTLPLGGAGDMIIVVVKEGAQLHMESIVKGGEASSVLARTMLVVTENDTKTRIVSRTRDMSGLVILEHTALVAHHASCDFVDDPESPHSYFSRTNVLLLGEEAESEILHTLIAQGTARYDIWAGVEHRASNTRSRVYALGLVGDTSKIIYRGVIDMKSGVHNVDGAQEGKFLIVSPKAEVDAIPALDIASREVASSHKLSISHIRDIDLFYAKTRGIPDHAARELAIEGFFGSLLEKIKKGDMMENIRERIGNLTKR